MIPRFLLPIGLALCGLGSDAATQEAGFRDLAIRNVTGRGSEQLAVRAFYPATAAGENRPLLARSGGYPVVVHLHGQALAARTYDQLGAAFVRAGFVAVLSDTAPRDADLQVEDGIALFASLASADRDPGFVLAGAFDMARAGLCGHSMGGGSTVRVLAANPGYLAGFGFAPWDGTIGGSGPSWSHEATEVRVPLAFVHGEGDRVVDLDRVGLLFYTRASGYTGLKVFARLDTRADHANVVYLSASPSASDLGVHQLSLGMVTGWFDRHLRGGDSGLAAVVGQSMRSSQFLETLFSEYRRPELWRVGSARIGTSIRFALGGEPGRAGIYLSPMEQRIALPFGTLRLDPGFVLPLIVGRLDATRVIGVDANVPNDPVLVGSRAHLQGLAAGGPPPQKLTELVTVVIQ